MRTLKDVLKQIDTQPLVDRILQEYKARGYNGEFAKTLACKVVDTSLVFTSCYYGYFMLYGRGPTRDNYHREKDAPTLYQVIKKWCATKGIPEEAAGAITTSIHKDGTKGKDFITPILPELRSMIVEAMYNEIKKNGIYGINNKFR